MNRRSKESRTVFGVSAGGISQRLMAALAQADWCTLARFHREPMQQSRTRIDE
jgi:hypothetical protein